MPQKHITAKSAKAARKKATNKTTVVGRVNYIKGTKKKNGTRTYNVTTHKRKKKA